MSNLGLRHCLQTMVLSTNKMQNFLSYYVTFVQVCHHFVMGLPSSIVKHIDFRAIMVLSGIYNSYQLPLAPD